MKFNDNQSIFIQIADYVCEQILKKTYQVDMQIPSVRELGIKLEVNPNTVMRAYERLSSNEIIYNKRGIGYFVSNEAENKILLNRKKKLVEEVLPAIFEEMNLLGITDDELILLHNSYNKKISSDE